MSVIKRVNFLKREAAIDYPKDFDVATATNLEWKIFFALIKSEIAHSEHRIISDISSLVTSCHRIYFINEPN